MRVVAIVVGFLLVVAVVGVLILIVLVVVLVLIFLLTTLVEEWRVRVIEDLFAVGANLP